MSRSRGFSQVGCRWPAFETSTTTASAIWRLELQTKAAVAGLWEFWQGYANLSERAWDSKDLLMGYFGRHASANAGLSLSSIGDIGGDGIADITVEEIGSDGKVRLTRIDGVTAERFSPLALVGDINTAISPGEVQQFAAAGDAVYLVSQTSEGYELWLIDRTSGKTKTLRKFTNSPGNLTVVGEVLFFTMNDGESGTELWRSDGSAVGTIAATNINHDGGAYPQNLANVNGKLFFAAQDPMNGQELWLINGDGTGLTPVTNINPSGDSSPSSLTNVNGQLFFSVQAPTKGLWRVNRDGTGLSQILSSFSSIPQNLTNVNGRLFFNAKDVAIGNELWRVNGDGTGLTPVTDINPSGDPYPRSLTNVNGQLFFTAFTPTKGRELWRMSVDGTGVTRVVDIALGLSVHDPNYLTNVNGQLFFGVYDPTIGLWRVNGDGTGLSQVSSSFSSIPRNLTNVNGRLFFSANGAAHGNELWRVNGDGTDSSSTNINPSGDSVSKLLYRHANGRIVLQGKCMIQLMACRSLESGW